MTYNVEPLGWIAWPSLIMLVLTCTSFPQRKGENNERPPSIPSRPNEGDSFLVAFELSPEREFVFTWPLESMRPAPYDTVLMVIEKMPLVFDKVSRVRKPKPLMASRHLRINGRLQRPLRNARSLSGKEQESKQQFLVKLERGRLRLSLAVPLGVRLHPSHRTAGIRLYQVNKAAISVPYSRLLAGFQQDLEVERNEEGIFDRCCDPRASIKTYSRLHTASVDKVQT